MGSSFLFAAHVPQAFVALFLLETGGGCPDRNKDKKSACHSQKENGKRQLVGFVFSFGYEKGAAWLPCLYRWCSVVKLFPFLNYLLNS